MSEIWLLAIILLALVGGLLAGLAKPAAMFFFASLLCYLLGLVDLTVALGSFTNNGVFLFPCPGCFIELFIKLFSGIIIPSG